MEDTVWTLEIAQKGSNCKVGLIWGAVWMEYYEGTETVAIFVI
jgi:hypothetical protein